MLSVQTAFYHGICTPSSHPQPTTPTILTVSNPQP